MYDTDWLTTWIRRYGKNITISNYRTGLTSIIGPTCITTSTIITTKKKHKNETKVLSKL